VVDGRQRAHITDECIQELRAVLRRGLVDRGLLGQYLCGGVLCDAVPMLCDTVAVLLQSAAVVLLCSIITAVLCCMMLSLPMRCYMLRVRLTIACAASGSVLRRRQYLAMDIRKCSVMMRRCYLLLLIFRIISFLAFSGEV
jgi:hypothetical protein